MGEHIYYLSLAHLAKLIKTKEISPVEITKECLNRIENLKGKLNSFITVLHDNALKEAKKAEEEILNGHYRGTLHGIPYTLKDLFFTKGIRTTMGSKIYDSYTPAYNSTIGDKLAEAGAILLGKTNMHPFAYGMTGENPEYGHSRNPWNEQLITGGSSSGSASAVAAGECVFSIGSDTGGSIRLPASLCGIVGFKPTYGLVSKHGAAALSWSQDHAGPMARSVEDCAIVMNTIAGYDINDPGSILTNSADYTSILTGDIRGMKIGLPKEFSKQLVDSEVNNAVLQAINKLEELGAIIKDVSWPMLDKAMAIGNTIQMSEAISYHSDTVKNHGPEIYEPVRMRLHSGFFVSARDYLQAQRARVLYFRDSIKMMEDVDVVVSPCSPVPAIEIGTQECEIGGERKNVVALLSQYTRPFNLNGFPAISLPCGFSDKKLPIGLQIAGKPFAEKKVLQIAYAYEQSTDWSNRRPIA